MSITHIVLKHLFSAIPQRHSTTVCCTCKMLYLNLIFLRCYISACRFLFHILNHWTHLLCILIILWACLTISVAWFIVSWVFFVVFLLFLDGERVDGFFWLLGEGQFWTLSPLYSSQTHTKPHTQKSGHKGERMSINYHVKYNKSLRFQWNMALFNRNTKYFWVLVCVG